MNTTMTVPTQANGFHPHAEEIVHPVVPDEFDSEEFESQRESLPYLQVLNNQSHDLAGFFIAQENVETVNFVPADEWVPHTTVFQNGEAVEGYRALLARFLILRQSKLMMFERESGDFIGLYRKGRYDRNTMLLKNRYLVYLISKDKRLLHDSPLLLTTKGAFSGSFGDAFRQFQRDMSKAYGVSTGARRPRGDKFMALSIFGVRLQPELKGRERKSWACSVAEFGVPTAENWRSYFVGYDAVFKERILREFEEWKDFGSVEREVEAQATRTQQSAGTEEPQQPEYPEFESDIPPYEEL